MYTFDRQIFYDLGSGCGKAVVAAALSSRVRFLKCVGIELLPSLCFCASAVVSALTSPSSSSIPLPPSSSSHLSHPNRSSTLPPNPNPNRESFVTNNHFLKSFKSAVFKTLQASFAEDTQLNESSIRSIQDMQPTGYEDAASAAPYAEESKEPLQMAMNMSSIHSEESVRTANTSRLPQLQLQHQQPNSLRPNHAKDTNGEELNAFYSSSRNVQLSSKIVSSALASAASLFSIPKNIASRIQAARIRLPITEIR